MIHGCVIKIKMVGNILLALQIILLLITFGETLKCYSERKGDDDTKETIQECTGEENVCYTAYADLITTTISKLSISFRGCGVTKVYCDVCKNSVLEGKYTRCHAFCCVDADLCNTRSFYNFKDPRISTTSAIMTSALSNATMTSMTSPTTTTTYISTISSSTTSTSNNLSSEIPNTTPTTTTTKNTQTMSNQTTRKSLIATETTRMTLENTSKTSKMTTLPTSTLPSTAITSKFNMNLILIFVIVSIIQTMH